MIRLDWRTLHAALATDLRLRLAAGLERDRMAATGACPWLLWSALAAALVGGVLYLLGGYHVGFHTLNHLAAGWPPGFWEWLTVLGDARLAIALALFFSLRHPRLFWALILAALVATRLHPWHQALGRGLASAGDAASGQLSSDRASPAQVQLSLRPYGDGGGPAGRRYLFC
jgi:hypothetical protein